LRLPTSKLGVFEVRPHQVAGPEAGLCATLGRPNLHDDVAVVIRVAWSQELAHLFDEAFALQLQPNEVLARQLTQVRVAAILAKGADVANLLEDRLELLVDGNRLCQVALFPTQLLPPLAVAEHFRTGHHSAD